MSAVVPPLPPEIAAILGDAPRVAVADSWSTATVERVLTSPVVFLKSAPVGGPVAREAARLRWLAEVTAGDWFPRVVVDAMAEGWEHLVLSACDGVSLFEWARRHGADAGVHVLVQALRRVGSLPVERCPFELPTPWLIEIARASVAEGVDPSWIDESAPGSTAADLLAIAERDCPSVPSVPAMVHGDFYPANILVDDNGQWAVLDWPWSGVGDRHRDVSKAAATVATAWGADSAEKFLSGVDLPIDETALRGFTALHPLL